MAPTPREISFLLHPLVPESLNHNRRVISNIRSLTSFLLGISAAILHLTSLYGFLYYILGSTVVSILIHLLVVQGSPETYFPGDRTADVRPESGVKSRDYGAWKFVWLGGGVLSEGISGFVLGWAGVGGVIR